MAKGAHRVRVWDLPTRLSHWSLAACVIVACASAKADGDAALRLHFLSGYAVLCLVLFRVLWGFAGPRHARFAQFVRGPGAVLAYLRAPGPIWGHSPLGALSILALLAASGIQGASGMFTRDEIASEGPWARFVSEFLVGRFSQLHAWGEPAVYGLVGLHLAAIAWYRLARSENLVLPMITGDKPVPDAADPGLASADDARVRGSAVLLLALCAALVVFVVRLGQAG